MTDAKLKSYVDRIERLDGEQQTVGLDKRSVYDEAKAAGYDKKALRRLIAERKREDKDAATIAKVEEYRALLAMPGATVRSVAAQVGTSKTKVQRLVPKKDSGTSAIVDTDLTVINEPPRAPETGVIIEDAAPQACVDGELSPVVPCCATPQPLSEGGDGIGHQVPASGDAGNTGGDHEPGLSLAPQDDGASNHVVPAADNSAHEIAPTPSGMAAVCAQHEIDHLDGVLFHMRAHDTPILAAEGLVERAEQDNAVISVGAQS